MKAPRLGKHVRGILPGKLIYKLVLWHKCAFKTIK